MTEPFAIFRPFTDRVRVRLYDRSDGIASREDLARLEGLPLADAEQPHGSLTLVVREGSAARIPGADGLATDAKGFALATRGADCQMFAFYDPAHDCGGVLHAGWRGLVAGAIPAFVETMKREWNTDPADLLVGAGPSLCFDCGEFTDPAKELTGIDPKFFRARLADLCAVAEDQLHAAGVTLNHVERHADCTRCDKEQWWSLRGGHKEYLQAGNQNALTFSLL